MVPCYPSGGQRNDSSQFWWGDPRLLTIHVCGGQRNGSSQFWWGAPRLLTIHEPGNAMARHNSGGGLLVSLLSMWRANGSSQKVLAGDNFAPHCACGGQRNGSSQFWWGAPWMDPCYTCGEQMDRHKKFWWGTILLLAVAVAGTHDPSRNLWWGAQGSSLSSWRARMSRRANQQMGTCRRVRASGGAPVPVSELAGGSIPLSVNKCGTRQRQNNVVARSVMF